jgi:hypothetical protein
MANLTQSIAELRSFVSQCETEVQALLNGKKASAPRIRASLQKIKTLSHAMRGDVMEHVKTLPTKAKAKKVESVELPPNPPVLERQRAEEIKPKQKRATSKKTSKDKTTE